MSNVLVLGGNGYLGSKIINELLHDCNVFCTIKRGESSNLLIESSNVTVVADDIEKIKEIIVKKKINLIINTVCCYERDGMALSAIISANLLFPLSIIPFAIENGVTKIITVDTSLPENVNLYALSKKSVSKIGEYYCKRINNLIFYNITLENFYGKDEPKNRFLHVMVDKLKRNEQLDLTEGRQRRDFIYLDDVLSAFDILIKNDDFGFHNISVGTEEGPTIREVIEFLKEMIHSSSKLNFGAISSRENEPDCVANLDYLRKYGFKIKYPYKRGLKEII